MDDEGKLLLRRRKRWRLAKWICFAALASSIVLALTAALSRLSKTAEMIDGGTAGDLEYRQMNERATSQTIFGLGAGCAGILGYLVCAVMQQRASNDLKTWQVQERRAKLAELGVSPSDL